MGLIAYGLIALALIGALGGIGYKVRESGKDAIRVEWAAANEVARKREAEASAKAAADLAAERKKRRTVIQERTVYVDREIEKLVDSGTCFRPSGVQCLNAVINGEDAAGCKPDGAVPATNLDG